MKLRSRLTDSTGEWRGDQEPRRGCLSCSLEHDSEPRAMTRACGTWEMDPLASSPVFPTPNKTSEISWRSALAEDGLWHTRCPMVPEIGTTGQIPSISWYIMGVIASEKLLFHSLTFCILSGSIRHHAVQQTTRQKPPFRHHVECWQLLFALWL